MSANVHSNTVHDVVKTWFHLVQKSSQLGRFFPSQFSSRLAVAFAANIYTALRGGKTQDESLHKDNDDSVSRSSKFRCTTTTATTTTTTTTSKRVCPPTKDELVGEESFFYYDKPRLVREQLAGGCVFMNVRRMYHSTLPTLIQMQQKRTTFGVDDSLAYAFLPRCKNNCNKVEYFTHH